MRLANSEARLTKLQPSVNITPVTIQLNKLETKLHALASVHVVRSV